MKEIARLLLSENAVMLNPAEPFTFDSGIKSPIYCDNRVLTTKVESRHKILKAYQELLDGLSFDVVAGTSTAGIPWAAWLAEMLGKDFVYVRKEPKGHGTGKQVEGSLKEGSKVVIIEDLVSTGGSSLACVEGVRKAGGVVEDCVAIFTYGMEKATQGFEEAQCKLHVLTNFETLVQVAADEGFLNTADVDKVLSWNKDPEHWGRGDS